MKKRSVRLVKKRERERERKRERKKKTGTLQILKMYIIRVILYSVLINTMIYH